MTREEAERQARLRREQDGGAWLVREIAEGGDFEVVQIKAPGLVTSRPSGAHVESKPKPSQPDDPRTAFTQNIPPYGG